MNLDVSKSIEAKSDQLNAEDFLSGSRTITITDVTRGSAEQPWNLHNEQYPDRVYRPCKSMLRVLAHLWGTQAGKWIGKSLTLYRDPNVTFGRDKVGGIRISHMEGLTNEERVPLIATRGRKVIHKVLPLTAPAQPDQLQVFIQRAKAATSADDLNAIYHDAAKLGEPPAQLIDALNVKKQELAQG